MKPPTRLQLRLLLFLIAHHNTHQRYPTVREVCNEMGWKSPNSGTRCLNELRRKGLIKRQAKGIARACMPAVKLELTPEALTR